MNATAPAPVIDTRKPVALKSGHTARLEKIRYNAGLPTEKDVDRIYVRGIDPANNIPWPTDLEVSRAMGGKHCRGPLPESTSTEAIYEA